MKTKLTPVLALTLLAILGSATVAQAGWRRFSFGFSFGYGRGYYGPPIYDSYYPGYYYYPGYSYYPGYYPSPYRSYYLRPHGVRIPGHGYPVPAYRAHNLRYRNQHRSYVSPVPRRYYRGR